MIVFGFALNGSRNRRVGSFREATYACLQFANAIGQAPAPIAGMLSSAWTANPSNDGGSPGAMPFLHRKAPSPDFILLTTAGVVDDILKEAPARYGVLSP